MSFGQLEAFIMTSCKKVVPKFIHMKKTFGEKGHIVLFNSNLVGSLYHVWTL
jgi:hypothetical protein